MRGTKKGLRNTGFTLTSTENQTTAVEVLDYFIQKEGRKVLNFAPGCCQSYKWSAPLDAPQV
jgi:hypothetical protein